MQGGQSNTARGVEGRPSLMKRDLGPGKLAHASPWHTDKLVAGWLQGMLPQRILRESERVLGFVGRAHAIGWADSPLMARTRRVVADGTWLA